MPPSSVLHRGACETSTSRRPSRLSPILLKFAAHRLACRVLYLDPRLRWSTAIGRVRPLRHDALQPHAADMREHGWPVTCQMLNEPDRSPVALADQSGEPTLTLDQRQPAQVVAV